MMRVGSYYNEIDPFAAAWLRELIRAGKIAPGEVDERSIENVEPNDLAGYVQCHFFAGIGGWDLALQLAGWPDDRPVWTGSCPCQPFSAAGKGNGVADSRHLWPEMFRLIRECRPAVVFGEQVASAIGHGWLDLVSDDLEGEGYAVGAAVFPACSVGAFHIRQRLYWVALSTQQQYDRSRGAGTGRRAEYSDGRPTGGLALPHDAQRRAEGPGGHDGHGQDTGRQEGPGDAQGCGRTGGLAEPKYKRPPCPGSEPQPEGQEQQPCHLSREESSPWSNAVWLPCRDGKARPVEPAIFPLAHGVSGRVGVPRPEGLPASVFPEETRWVNRMGVLKGGGNAIVPQQAAAFIQAVMEV